MNGGSIKLHAARLSIEMRTCGIDSCQWSHRKAFRGELVSHNPADQPAETLLARIRAACAPAPKSKHGRRRKGAA